MRPFPRPIEPDVSVMGWPAIVLVATMLVSCGRAAGTARMFTVLFVAESDPGVRLAGVHVSADGKPMGKTDSDGRLRARIHSEPDQPVRIEHRCPDGHAEPAQPKVLRLRKFEGVSDSYLLPMEITLRCRPNKRLAVFVIRAKNGPDLPVLLDGESVTRTNPSGVAHLSAWGTAGTEYSIQLDTSEHPRLLPKSPTHQVTLPDAHEIFVVNQSFEVAKEPARRGRRRARIIRIE
ncbi:MAG: hypothetical protein WCE62_21190 [Polyangiales bacterium]